MKSLDRKLFRDLLRMRGQALAIVLVIASGVSSFIMLKVTMGSLYMTRDKFYRDFGFADVFVSLKRAPEELGARIGAIKGVRAVQTRVVAGAKLEIKGFGDPVTARLVSVPDRGRPALDRAYIKSGRNVRPWSEDEAVISEAFAAAHGFVPGDHIVAVINGRQKRLTIVGLALSPEFVMQARPGSLSPDYLRYAIIWMGRNALANAYDMKGAFNDLAISLYKDADAAEVMRRVDAMLARYGGLTAYERKDQTSNRYLDSEFHALEMSSRVFPAVFIAVAAFLLNVVINRTIGLQREQIGTLKAFGYSDRAIGLHYTKMVMIITAVGIAAGIGAGMRLGEGLAGIYMRFYRFPYLIGHLAPGATLVVILITMGSALAATFVSVRKAALAPPAEAMRPLPPATYGKTILERLGLGPLMSQPTRMIMRSIERRPLKSALTITGIALSCAIVIGGTFFQDAIEYLLDTQFIEAQREDMTVVFNEPTSRKALFELRDIEGVHYTEPLRTVPVRLRFGHRSYRTIIQGIAPRGSLYLLLDKNLKSMALPPEGMVLNDYLADMLKVSPGDLITVEVLEGRRPVRRVPVTGLVRQYAGLLGFMDIDALNGLMMEDGAITGAYLTMDPFYRRGLYERLVDMPRVSGAIVTTDELNNFNDTQTDILLFYTLIASILAGTIAFGVVYNSARISLSERSRELASLRVLGYRRVEISYILLGELGALTLMALPLGFVIGWGLSVYLAEVISSNLFRIPHVVAPSTYALSALVVVASALVSGILVHQRLVRLDLVEVLKSRE